MHTSICMAWLTIMHSFLLICFCFPMIYSDLFSYDLWIKLWVQWKCGPSLVNRAHLPKWTCLVDHKCGPLKTKFLLKFFSQIIFFQKFFCLNFFSKNFFAQNFFCQFFFAKTFFPTILFEFFWTKIFFDFFWKSFA